MFSQEKNRTITIENKVTHKRVLIVGVFLLIVVILLIILYTESIITQKLDVLIILSFAALTIGVSGFIFNQVDTSLQEPHFFMGEKFEDLFKKILDKNNSNTFIFQISNIDRCDPDVVYSLLSDIKTFLSDEKVSKGNKLVFIVLADEIALKKHIQSTLDKENTKKELEVFLNKVFDMIIRIRKRDSFDLWDFINELNEKYDLNLKNDTLELISEYYTNKQSKVIGFINRFLIFLSYFDDKEFIKRYESLIAKFLIIKEEFPHTYGEILKNIYIVCNKEKFLDYSILNKESQEFKNFNNMSSFIHTQDYKVIHNIINVFEDFDAIPESLKLAIRNNNPNNFSHEIRKNKVNPHAVLGYLINDLKHYYETGAYDLFINRVNLLIVKYDYLNIDELDNEVLKGINQLMSQLVTIVDLEDLVSFSKYLYDKGEDSIINNIINLKVANDLIKKEYANQGEILDKLN